MLCSISLIICMIFVNNALSKVARNRSEEEIKKDRIFFDSIVQPVKLITRASDIRSEERVDIRDMLHHLQKDIEQSIDEPEIYKRLKILYDILKQELDSSSKKSRKENY